MLTSKNWKKKRNILGRRNGRKKAFTLSEILVTIAIIGIIFSVLVGRVSKSSKMANDSTIDAQLNVIAMSLVDFFYDEDIVGLTNLTDLTEQNLATILNGYLITKYSATPDSAAVADPGTYVFNLKALDPWNRPYKLRFLAKDYVEIVCGGRKENEAYDDVVKVVRWDEVKEEVVIGDN